MHPPILLVLPLLSILGGLLSFVSKRKHLLNMLLSLEFLMLNLFLILTYKLNTSAEAVFTMYFLILAVCEGALGVSLLVHLVRSFGVDLIHTLRPY